ncbi:DUF3857 domain-containing protein [Sediminibacterium sp.]|uniref:DUF3857 domain-containing protein n=1 Tax=Sediminibacterium sp. TaxID=1917865 RepID=UPI0025EB27C0|nr:DUF3857 domain-containing protein [Sediminibacterium sp.]MBW0176552.1 DUF3857 domain-containing protein [Sediminibacterium sp.]
MRIYFYVVLLTCLLVNRSFGQARQYTQFGKVNLTEFDIQSTTSDTSTPAIVLSDVGVSEFEGNGNGNFTLVFKHHKRILIKNRLGFDAATIFISLYNGENSSSTEKLEDFEAYTYTRENGRISETKGKKDAVIQEKVNRERVLRKFTFPNIKEGCIIEFRYKVKSPFYNRLRSWNFQSEYPTLWSEYKVVIPPLFDYISSTYGYLDYTVNELSYVPKTYTIRDPISKMQDNNVFTVSGEALVNVWAVKDAPPFLAEPFVYSNLNHIKRIQFQLKSINYSATSTTKVIKDWSETAKDLLKDPDFGAQLEEDNNWLNEIVGKMNKQGELEASRSIYEFIRDRFVCTDFDSKWLSQSLKKTFETKTGTAADLNMLLVAMLRKAGLQSTPFIVSTRENGFVNQNYALPAQFNYTLCRVRINGQYYILDGAHKKLGFGDIPVYCYNGMGRIIDNTALPVVLSPDLLQENKYTNIKIANDDRSMRATIKIVYGKIESFQLRNKITSGKEEEIVRQILTNTPSDFKLLSFSFDSLDQFEKPLQLHIEMNYTTDPDASVLYFNPILLNEWTKNPFISTQRNYSVELPYKFKEEYQIEIAIPKGYKIEEVPSSSKLNMNGNDIRYEYTTRKDSQSVAISNLINASRIIFQKTEYNALRTFFMNIVKKNGEQLVFKKSE